LTILVYRGGPLAKAGHNHVIASHALRGSLYVPVDLAQSSFEIHMPVTELTVDEADLRAKENSDDFPPDVPDSAKEGTRHNMLSPALLDGDQYPEIVLRSERVEWVAEGPGGSSGVNALSSPGVSGAASSPNVPGGANSSGSGPNGSSGHGVASGSNVPSGANAPAGPSASNGPNGHWLAHVQVTIRDKTNPVVVPVTFEQHGDEIVVSGEFPLKQTDLGLTPFSALLGALQVIDEMKIRFHIVAHAAVTRTGR
jgi:polyisoprenoid-binding protein YceI